MFLIFIIFLIAYFAHHSIIEKDNRNALTANVLLANTVWILATMCPTITLQVRRLHDAGYSGWLWLVNLIPYVGGLILLLFMVQDSQRGTNQYGPNPKGEY